MADNFGIGAAVQRTAQHGGTTAGSNASQLSNAQTHAARAAQPATVAQQLAVAAPGLARVPLPPRPADEPAVRPKKAANPMTPARDMSGGSSPLSTGPVANTSEGASLLGGALAAPDERASDQAAESAGRMPTRHGLVAFTHSPRGEFVYLEQERWDQHIRQAHIMDPPNARGKRTTTWWPVLHSATGAQTMTEDQVIDTIMNAARHGHWQNAPRGTLLSVYDLDPDLAQKYGVSEVKVSAAPDGRILSAYPSAGSNVLAVRELTAEEQAAQAAAFAAFDQNDKLFTTNVPSTSFGD